jgi:cytochrome b561
VALLIVVLIGLGWVAVNWHLSPTKITLFVWHKSIGIVVLGVVGLRLLWRALDRRPAFPQDMSPVERRLATSVHYTLYLCMFAMPISGWIINSAADFPFKLFGLWPVPDLVAPNESVQEVAELMHLLLFWLLAGATGLHVLAALRHHFIDKNRVLVRMLPGYRNADQPVAKRSK